MCVLTNKINNKGYEDDYGTIIPFLNIKNNKGYEDDYGTIIPFLNIKNNNRE